MEDDNILLSMEGISKRFGNITALEGIDLEVKEQEVLGLVGDNGAGKSTLISCISGALSPDSGSIWFDSEKVNLPNPRKAEELGIETTFQDLAICDNLSVAQNIFLGQELTFGPPFVGIRKKKAMRTRAAELLDELNIDIPVEATAGNLSGGEQQLVAVSRTMLSDPKMIIMDEPTSALSVEGADQVLSLIERMNDNGITILLVSHNLEYIQLVTDRIQVLHQGENAGVLMNDGVEKDDIVQRMIAGATENVQTEA